MRKPCPLRLYDLILATNSAMRSIACSILSIEVAYEQRIWPSPQSPNALPGTTATFSSKSSRSQNSSELRPVSFDRRKRVERPARHQARQASVVQALDNHSPPLRVLLDHILAVLVAVGDGLQSGDLRHYGRAEHGELVNLHHGVYDLGRSPPRKRCASRSSRRPWRNH